MNWMIKDSQDELVKHLDEGCTEAAALTGTEKQVEWAANIRLTYIAAIEQAWEQMVAQGRAAGGTEKDLATYEAKYARILSGLRGIRTARTWIEGGKDTVNGYAQLQMLMSLVT